MEIIILSVLLLASIIFSVKILMLYNKQKSEIEQLSQDKLTTEINFANRVEYTQNLEKQLSELKTGYEDAKNLNNILDKQLELNKQKMQLQLEEINKWKQDQERYLEITRASILKAGSEMSSKLLDDHKRESHRAQQVSEERVKQTTEKLNEQFKNIFESMHHLNQKMTKVEVIERSLLSPQGAGCLAEITLSNIFKCSNLTQDIDYILQHWIEKNEGGGSKPDAVVFLPCNNIMVIDSKASKFFVELENLASLKKDNNADLIECENNIKKTMHKHLKDLVSRDYKQAIIEQIQGRCDNMQINNVSVMMFLPTEVALETIRRIDKNFEEKAWQSQIIPIGPAGLVNALLQAKLLIGNAKQEQYSQKILSEVKKLLTSVAKLYDLSDNLGKSIKSSFEKYDKFAASFNGNFLVKAKKINDYGVESENTNLNTKLKRYQLISTSEYIEAEEIDNILTELENQPG